MTMPASNYPYALGGLQNGRYRQTLTQASSGSAQQASATNLGALGSVSDSIPDPDTAVEDAGIRAGEITAYRVWDLADTGFLHSVYISQHIWLPGVVVHAPKVRASYGEGIHAFKSMDRALAEYGYSFFRKVYGEVALWGDVVEFEHGWKAEYAAITKLDFILCDGRTISHKRPRWFRRETLLDQVRKRYGLTPQLSSNK
jgi:hypothetical protein